MNEKAPRRAAILASAALLLAALPPAVARADEPQPKPAAEPEPAAEPKPAEEKAPGEAQAPLSESAQPPRKPVLEPFVPEPETPGLPRVHIDAGGAKVELYDLKIDALNAAKIRAPGRGPRAATDAAEPSALICVAPCDEKVDARERRAFFLKGNGIPASSPFQLSGRTGDVLIHVTPGSRARAVSGGVLGIAGGTTLAIGALVFALHRFAPPEAPNPAQGAGPKDGIHLADDNYMVPSAILMGTGAAALITGVVLWATSGTHYRIEGKP